MNTWLIELSGNWGHTHLKSFNIKYRGTQCFSISGLPAQTSGLFRALVFLRMLITKQCKFLIQGIHFRKILLKDVHVCSASPALLAFLLD